MKHILFVLSFSIIFSACIQKPKNNPEAVSNLYAKPLDTVTTVPSKIDAKPLLFETAFIKGTKDKVKDLTFTMYGVTVGNIKITSGSILACDPWLIDEYGEPFTQQFPTGEFPVQLSIAHLKGKGETVAFARIKFSDEPVAKWEYALIKGQKQAPVGMGDDIGFVVDAGFGIFVDKKAIDSLERKEISRIAENVYKQVNQDSQKGWSADIYKFGDNNLAAFTSGFGDGRYSTYTGFDANGKVCRLLTDFGLFEWNKK